MEKKVNTSKIKEEIAESRTSPVSPASSNLRLSFWLFIQWLLICRKGSIHNFLQRIPAGDVGQLESLHHSEHLCERPALLASVLCLLVKVVELIKEESMYLILELLQWISVGIGGHTQTAYHPKDIKVGTIIKVKNHTEEIMLVFLLMLSVFGQSTTVSLDVPIQ